VGRSAFGKARNKRHLCALATSVKRFQIRQQARTLNNVLRGFGKLTVSVE
jgi:hypothetical protein